MRPTDFEMSRAPSSIGFNQDYGADLLFEDFELVPGSGNIHPSPMMEEMHVAPNMDMIVEDLESANMSLHSNDTPKKPKRKPRKKKSLEKKVDQRTFVPYQDLFSHHQAQPSDGVERSILPATYFTDLNGQVPMSWYPFPDALPQVISRGLISGFEYGDAEKALRHKWRMQIDERETLHGLKRHGGLIVPEYEAIWEDAYVKDNIDRFDELFDKKRKANSSPPGPAVVKRKRKNAKAQGALQDFPDQHDFHGQEYGGQEVQEHVDSVELGRRVEASPAPWQNYMDKPRSASETRSENRLSKHDQSPLAQWGEAPWSASGGASFGLPTREGSLALDEPQLPISDSLLTDGPASVPFELKDQVAHQLAQELEKETKAFFDYMKDVCDQAGMQVTIFSDLVPKGTGRDQVANAFAYSKKPI
jgi:hypothetical protein